MYEVVKAEKKKKSVDYDYIFKDFTSFYEIAQLVTYPLNGRYKIRIDTDSVKDIFEFLKVSEQYEMLSITIYAAPAVVEQVSMRKPNVPVKEQVRGIDILKGLISQKRLLLGKGVLYDLYNAIAHDTETMAEAVELLAAEYGESTEISNSMLAKHFILNKVVYPRDVVNAFIWKSQWRWKKLGQCVALMSNAVVKGAIVNNLKKIVQEKNAFFTTGNCSRYIRSLDTESVLRMYSVFVSNNCGLQDVFILFKLYERGYSVYDLLHEEEL